MSKLRVNDVIPANGLNIGIGTAGGNFIVGGASTTVVVNGSVNSTGTISASTFIGDGSGITGVTASGSGINIKDSGSIVGVAATIDFSTNLNVSPASAGIVTVTVGDSDFAIVDKIIHTDDTDTAIRFPAADTITAETGGSERLRITSAGLVGIGTDNPGNPLHVLGADPQIKIQDSENGNHAQIFLDGPNSNLNFDWVSGSARKINLMNSGGGSLKVGIGTTIPSSTLSVDGYIESLSDSSYASTNEGGQIILRAPRGQPSGTKYRYQLDNYWGEADFGRATSGSNEVSGIRFVREDDDPAANGIVLMSLAQDGILQLPYQPAFDAVYDPGGGTTGYTSSNTEIVFNVTNNNRGSHYSTTTGRFTAPITGTYFFSFGGMNAGTTGGTTAWYELRVNGNLLTNPHNPYASVSTGGFRHVTSQYTLALNDGDYVSVFTGSTTGGIYGGGNNHNHFVGYLIG